MLAEMKDVLRLDSRKRIPLLEFQIGSSMKRFHMIPLVLVFVVYYYLETEHIQEVVHRWG